MKHTILFLAANPIGTDPRALDREARAIQMELERSGFRHCFELVTRWAAEPLDLLRELRKLKPTVVHFSGHGSLNAAIDSSSGAVSRRDVTSRPSPDHGEPQPGLFFQGPDGRPQLVSSKALEDTFGALGAAVKLVVLSACYSEVQTKALLPHVGCVVGMSGAIDGVAARSFAIGFYGGLGERESVAAAYKQGCAAISLGGLYQSNCPQLAVRVGIDASKLILAVTPAVPPASQDGADATAASQPRPLDASNAALSTVEIGIQGGSSVLVQPRRRFRVWYSPAIAIAGLIGAGLYDVRSCRSPAGEPAARHASVETKPRAEQAARSRTEPPPAPPGMVWMQPAEVVLGSAAADVRAVRMQCIEVAGRDLCNRLDQIGYWGREPQRRVKVDGFWIDRKEVTVGSFVAWLREQRGLQMRSSAIELDGEVVAGFGEMVLHDDAGFHARIGFEEGPMIDVTWQGAARYCADRGARLPSGTEWERTARGDGGRFPWGDGPPACRDAVLSRLGAACPGPERPEIAGRGERDRTREGVLDLVGNVSEWMREAGREPGTHEVRGGSYGASWVLARPAGRTFHPGRAVDVGFRCAAPPNRSIQDIGP